MSEVLAEALANYVSTNLSEREFFLSLKLLNAENEAKELQARVNELQEALENLQAENDQLQSKYTDKQFQAVESKMRLALEVNKRQKAEISVKTLEAEIQRMNLENSKKSIDAPGGKDEDMYKVPLEVPDGSQIWVTGKTLAALCENYHQKKSKLEATNTSKKGDKEWTFNNFADKCLQLKEDGGMKPTSLKTKKARLNMLRPYIGEKLIADINKADIQDAINALGKKETSHDTIKRVIGECRSLFTEAIENRLIDYNPAEKIKNPTKKPLQEQGYTEEEYAKLITEVLPSIPEKEDMLRYLMAISLALGARTQEIAAFTRDDFDFTDSEKPTVRIMKRAVWDGNQAHLEEGTKTEAGLRTLAIESWAIPYIKPVVERSGDGFILRGKCNKDGRTIVSQSFITSLYQKSAQFTAPVIGKPFKCYQGRHTKATIMDNAGIGGVAIADFMGHSDTTGNFTRSQYAKRKSVSTQKTSEKTEDYLKKLISRVGAPKNNYPTQRSVKLPCRNRRF